LNVDKALGSSIPAFLEQLSEICAQEIDSKYIQAISVGGHAI